MKIRILVSTEDARNVFLAVLTTLVMSSCATSSRSPTGENGDLFYMRNTTLDGNPVQVIKAKFGLGMLPTRTNVTIEFGTNGSLLVSFNKNTLKPESIMLTTTLPDGRWQTVFDSNADGIPEGREIEGEKNRQLFLDGKWYPYERSGTNYIIIRDGKRVPFFFDGSTFHQNTNQIVVPKPSSSPEVTRR